jgi:hypothetical protein
MRFYSPELKAITMPNEKNAYKKLNRREGKMNEVLAIIFYNLAIIFVLLLGLGLFIKYQHKKRADAILENMKKSHSTFAVDRKSQAAFEKRVKEWERKHPIHAIKQRIKKRIEWLLP